MAGVLAGVFAAGFAGVLTGACFGASDFAAGPTVVTGFAAAGLAAAMGLAAATGFATTAGFVATTVFAATVLATTGFVTTALVTDFFAAGFAAGFAASFEVITLACLVDALALSSFALSGFALSTFLLVVFFDTDFFAAIVETNCQLISRPRIGERVSARGVRHGKQSRICGASARMTRTGKTCGRGGLFRRPRASLDSLCVGIGVGADAHDLRSQSERRQSVKSVGAGEHGRDSRTNAGVVQKYRQIGRK